MAWCAVSRQARIARESWTRKQKDNTEHCQTKKKQTRNHLKRIDVRANTVRKWKYAMEIHFLPQNCQKHKSSIRVPSETASDGGGAESSIPQAWRKALLPLAAIPTQSMTALTEASWALTSSHSSIDTQIIDSEGHVPIEQKQTVKSNAHKTWIQTDTHHMKWKRWETPYGMVQPVPAFKFSSGLTADKWSAWWSATSRDTTWVILCEKYNRTSAQNEAVHQMDRRLAWMWIGFPDRRGANSTVNLLPQRSTCRMI